MQETVRNGRRGVQTIIIISTMFGGCGEGGGGADAGDKHEEESSKSVGNVCTCVFQPNCGVIGFLAD